MVWTRWWVAVSVTAAVAGLVPLIAGPVGAEVVAAGSGSAR